VQDDAAAEKSYQAYVINVISSCFEPKRHLYLAELLSA
jgi:hypothetical protein